MTELDGFCIAILATDGFEEPELVQALRELQAQGAEVDVLAPKPEIQGFKSGRQSESVLATGLIENAIAANYHGVLIPDGPECCSYLAKSTHTIHFLQELQREDKPIASMGRATQILAVAGLVRGRKVSVPPEISEVMTEAGAECVDASITLDGNWITTRSPSKSSEFLREAIALFSRTTPPVIRIEQSA